MQYTRLSCIADASQLAVVAALSMLSQKTEVPVNDALTQLPLPQISTSTDRASTVKLLQIGFPQSLHVLPKNFEEQNPGMSSLQLGSPAQFEA